MATFVYETNEPTQVYDDLDEKKVNHFLISERTSKFTETPRPPRRNTRIRENRWNSI